MTGVLFEIPIIKHVYTWMGASSVAKKRMLKLNEAGYSVVICPGGVKEVKYLSRRKERVTLYLRERKNFTKFALQIGAPIVPTYMFGQEKIFDFVLSDNKLIVSLGEIKYDSNCIFIWY